MNAEASTKGLQIAWFCPSSGIAAYFFALVSPYLTDKHRLVLFNEGVAGGTSYEEALDIHRETPFDIFFYQLQDDAAFCRSHLELVPGVVLCHNLYTTPRVFSENQGQLRRNYLYPQYSSVAEPINHFHCLSHNLPLPALSSATLWIFTSQRESGDFCRLLSGLDPEISNHVTRRVYYLPCPAHILERTGENQIAVVGATTPEHRIHLILEAHKNSQVPYHLSWLVDVAERNKALELVSSYGIPDQTTLVHDIDPAAWSEIVAKGEIAFHTSLSAYRNLNPWLNISLAAGVATVVSDFAEGGALSDNICLKVPPGAGEYKAYLDALNAPNKLREIAECGRLFALEHFQPQVVAQELCAIFEQNASQLQLVQRKWDNYTLHKTARHKKPPVIGSSAR